MDRLEAVEIRLSELIIDNSNFRIDDEMFSKQHIYTKKMLSKRSTKKLADISTLITDFGAFSQTNFIEFLDNGVLFLRNQDVKDNYIDLTNNTFISEKVYDKLSLKLDENDILIPRVGTLGKAAVVKKEYLPCTANQNLAQVKICQEFSPYFISTYLNTYFAHIQIDSSSTGNVQQWLNLENVGKIQIPIFPINFQEVIEKIVLQAHDLIDESKTLYSAAQDLLLSELRLADYTPTNKGISIKTFANSFGSSGRLDAEYYQPKYDEVEEKINSYKNGTEILKCSCNLYDNNFIPLDNQDYRYIELSNVGGSGEIVNVETQKGHELPTRARRKVKSNQVIISSIEGSLNSCALITEDYDNLLCSTGFYVIDSDKINPETLLVLFKSEPIQALLKRRCSGTILTAINKDEFLSIPIPIIKKDVQGKIAAMVKKMYLTRKKSAALLECAKKAVEMAVEEGEDVAMKWLEGQT